MYDLEKIEFKNEKRYLSNMYPCQIVISDNDFPNVKAFTYKSSEHLYQSLKSEDLNWHIFLNQFDRPENTKTEAKKRLKTLLANGKDTFLMKEGFHDIKYDLMYKIVYLKFSQNQDLKEKLINEVGLIEERNCWNDRYWGTVDGIGENNLGKILMSVRDILLHN